MAIYLVMASCPSAGGGVDVAVGAVLDHDGDVADVLAAHEGAVREEVPVLHDRVVLPIPLPDVLPAGVGLLKMMTIAFAPRFPDLYF